MPLGATPSRWCVCQFHHFRLKLLYLQMLADTPLGGPEADVMHRRFDVIVPRRVLQCEGTPNATGSPLNHPDDVPVHPAK